MSKFDTSGRLIFKYAENIRALLPAKSLSPKFSVSISGGAARMALPNRFSVGRTAGPAEAAIAMVFPSSLPDAQRAKAFAFNTKCLVQPRLCKTAEDILPGVWQLEPVVGPG